MKTWPEVPPHPLEEVSGIRQGLIDFFSGLSSDSPAIAALVDYVDHQEALDAFRAASQRIAAILNGSFTSSPSSEDVSPADELETIQDALGKVQRASKVVATTRDKIRHGYEDSTYASGYGTVVRAHVALSDANGRGHRFARAENTNWWIYSLGTIKNVKQQLGV